MDQERSLQLTGNNESHVRLLELPPERMVVEARALANTLASIIEQQKLYTKIGSGKHVKCEGWTSMGALLGVTAKERSVQELEDGSFEAKVDLVNVRSGLVIGSGSGFVGSDEKNWMAKPKVARRSMAVTRATSRAFRTNFSWIIALAGYEPTPFEEMEALENNNVSCETSSSQQSNMIEVYEEIEGRIEHIDDLEIKEKTKAYYITYKNDSNLMLKLLTKLRGVTK